MKRKKLVKTVMTKTNNLFFLFLRKAEYQMACDRHNNDSGYKKDNNDNDSYNDNDTTMTTIATRTRTNEDDDEDNSGNKVYPSVGLFACLSICVYVINARIGFQSREAEFGLWVGI